MPKTWQKKTYFDLFALAWWLARSPWAMLGVEMDLCKAPPELCTGLFSTPAGWASIPSPIICRCPWC